MPSGTSLLVFSDDWGRHPSSSQHLIRWLLPERQVIWVNTIGTRPPRLDWQTMRRVGEKLRHWRQPGVTQIQGSTATRAPLIISPKMWPSFTSSTTRRINRWALLKSLMPVVSSLDEPPIVITTLPLVADLVGSLPAKRWIYYCVDDFSVWPGYDGQTMRRMEAELVPKMDQIIAVSDTLVEHIAGLGKTAALLTHGVDLDAWQPSSSASNLPADLSGLEPPFIVFWGVVDRRMDTRYVAHLARLLESGTIVLFGPHDGPDADLLRLPRVVVRPPVPFSHLPSIAAAASALVMPYADLPVTRAMQPLKLKEYLATGRPTIVRKLPATIPWSDACDVCDTPEEFSRAVIERLVTGLPHSQRLARARLASESWHQKADQFRAWIDG